MNEQHLKYRDVVLKNKFPRRVYVQPEVLLVDGKVKYQKSSSDSFGCIDSGVSHYGSNVEDLL